MEFTAEQVVAAIVALGLTVSTMAGAVVFMFRLIRGLYDDRLKDKDIQIAQLHEDVEVLRDMARVGTAQSEESVRLTREQALALAKALGLPTTTPRGGRG